jgi:hypothetical protein
MKRWTNGLPGATQRLGAKMAHRGLSLSESRMRADTHDGPEHNAPPQRPNTLLQLSRSSILDLCLATHGRAIHIWHIASAVRVLSLRQLSSELRKLDNRRPWPALARLTQSRQSDHPPCRQEQIRAGHVQSLGVFWRLELEQFRARTLPGLWGR